VRYLKENSLGVPEKKRKEEKPIEKRLRRSDLQLFSDLLKMLKTENQAFQPYQLATKANIDHRTVKRFLQIMSMVQEVGVVVSPVEGLENYFMAKKLCPKCQAKPKLM
jgi:predicted transcriptional regulator